MPSVKISPSMLSSDFAMLAEEAKRMVDLGADYLHMDVMDGHFVPNLTLGAPVVKALRQHTDIVLDCHLMVSEPNKWIDDFAKAGASIFTFHCEAVENLEETLDLVHAAGMKAGVAVKPKTPIETIINLCHKIDMVLVMTVEPGFGGQSFMEDCLPKVREVRKRFPEIDIQVDGGLALDTIEKAAQAGANVIVAGTAIFKADKPGEIIQKFREVASKYQ
ncbi:ribulose-phosphate 3-epimerase [Neoconidiobolus thromboides FSU 785]|nr:ribulose-phosphate 3-epimerase [Neoconidiobolus thromboides FSU 785]